MKESLIQGPRARTVTVELQHAGRRIDNFLVHALKGVPRSRIYRILRRGEVRVNRARTRPSYRLRLGDQVRIPPLRQGPQKPPFTAPEGLRKRLEAAVLYEDPWLLVLNKPAGLAVHGGSGLAHGLVETLRLLRPEEPGLELVHRLDRATSGCLLLAKNREALNALQAQLREGRLEKRYLALTQGRWPAGLRQIDAALAKNRLQGGERMVCVDPGGRPAETRFEPLVGYGIATLVQVTLLTGRMHQIRVHAAHAGHPLAGDTKYGSAAFNRRMKALGLERLFLHAQSLGFRHPASAAPMTVNAPLEAPLQGLLERLEQDES